MKARVKATGDIVEVHTSDDAFIYENEEDRDKAYEEMLARQRALKDYDWEYETYETEIE